MVVSRDGGGPLLLLHRGHLPPAAGGLEDPPHPPRPQVRTVLAVTGSGDSPYSGIGLDLVPPRVLCDPVVEDPAYQPEPQDRPGGFLWGQVAPTC